MTNILNWNDILLIFVIAFLVSKIFDPEKLRVFLKILNDYKYLLGIIASLLLIFFLSGADSHKSKCIIVEKYMCNDKLFIVCKSLDGKIFKIPDAQKFWDAGKIKDTVWVTYVNTVAPKFTNVQPIKDTSNTAVFLLY